MVKSSARSSIEGPDQKFHREAPMGFVGRGELWLAFERDPPKAGKVEANSPWAGNASGTFLFQDSREDSITRKF